MRETFLHRAIRRVYRDDLKSCDAESKESRKEILQSEDD